MYPIVKTIYGYGKRVLVVSFNTKGLKGYIISYYYRKIQLVVVHCRAGDIDSYP